MPQEDAVDQLVMRLRKKTTEALEHTKERVRSLENKLEEEKKKLKEEEQTSANLRKALKERLEVIETMGEWLYRLYWRTYNTDDKNVEGLIAAFVDLEAEFTSPKKDCSGLAKTVKERMKALPEKTPGRRQQAYKV
jgi:DNA repair exonuclease SbcCD ATPase subunit